MSPPKKRKITKLSDINLSDVWRFVLPWVPLPYRWRLTLAVASLWRVHRTKPYWDMWIMWREVHLVSNAAPLGTKRIVICPALPCVHPRCRNNWRYRMALYWFRAGCNDELLEITQDGQPICGFPEPLTLSERLSILDYRAPHWDRSRRQLLTLSADRMVLMCLFRESESPRINDLVYDLVLKGDPHVRRACLEYTKVSTSPRFLCWGFSWMWIHTDLIDEMIKARQLWSPIKLSYLGRTATELHRAQLGWVLLHHPRMFVDDTGITANLPPGLTRAEIGRLVHCLIRVWVRTRPAESYMHRALAYIVNAYLKAQDPPVYVGWMIWVLAIGSRYESFGSKGRDYADQIRTTLAGELHMDDWTELLLYGNIH